MQEAIKLLSQDRNISFEWISNPSFFREMTSYFCTVKPQKPLLLIQKIKPGSNMNSVLGDLHHRQEFHWVKRIRCAKNTTSGIGEVMLGHTGTSLCTGDPSETRGDHSPKAQKCSSLSPRSYLFEVSSLQNPSNPSTAGLHIRTQKSNSKSPQC